MRSTALRDGYAHLFGIFVVDILVTHVNDAIDAFVSEPICSAWHYD